MNPELLQLVRILSMERPTDQGHPVSPEMYVEALHRLTKDSDIGLISSEPIMKKTGRQNTLFCGHFIYPNPTERLITLLPSDPQEP